MSCAGYCSDGRTLINRRQAIALLGAAFLAACRFPDDPEGTLADVTGGELKVGLLVPLATFREMAEHEALLVAAERIGAEPVLFEGRAHDLMAAVENGTIHLLAGGLPKDTPLSSRIALTKPWGRAAISGEVQDAVWGIRKGENAFLLALNRALAA